MAEKVIKRRAFIKLSTYTAAALAISFSKGCTGKPISAVAGQPLFFSHLVDVKTIQETGKAYRAKFPAEDNKNKLADLLLPDFNTSDPKAIQSFLDQQVKKDFETGKTVIIKGWVLSVTEARQCALFTLLQS